MRPDDQRYDYTKAGFNSFLTRSIDGGQSTLGVDPVVQTRQMAYDRSQVSGKVGDNIQIGGIRLTNKSILGNDGENDFLIIGDQE